MRIDSPKMTNAEVTGSFKGAFSGSFEGDIQADSVSFGNVTGKPTLISGSAQIVYGDIPSIPTVGDGGLTTNDFTNADHSKLDGIEANATADQTGAEIKTALFNESDTNNLTDTLLSKLNGIEASADVTDTANVKSNLPAGVISGSAADARAQLGVDAAGTDNSTDVTLGGSLDYITISGQTITRNAIDLTADVSGILPLADGGTGADNAADARSALGVDAAGTDNSTDVTLANTNYLSISGQEITGGTVPVGSGGTGATTAAGARSALGVDAAGTDNSTDVTLAGTPDYITISGQVITRNQIDLTSDVTGILPVGNMAATALTTVQTAANESAQLALTTQEGDVVVRTDESKTYMHNGGTAGTMADFTELATPTDSVTSVNGNTGAVTVTENVTTNLSVTANGTSLTVNSSDGTDASIPAATTSAWGAMTDEDKSKLDGIEANADVTDTANVTAAGALMDSELTDLAGVKAVTISTLQPKPSEGAFANGDKTKLDGIAAGATNVTNNNQLTNGAGYTTYTANQTLDNNDNVHFEGLMVGQTTGATANTIRCVGDVVAYYSSDAQFKDNVKPLEGALDKVKQIRGVEFDWNDKQDVYEGHDIGVIAQEVEEVYPELVHHREHNDSKAVDYVKLTAVLIEAVKELELKVAALEKK